MLHLLFLLFLPFALHADEGACPPPKYLYKITTLHNWCESQGRPVLKLLIIDDAYVLLATEGQIEQMIEEFWMKECEIVLLKLETAQLKGRLEYESSYPEGPKFYRLYCATIPREAVIESKIMRRDTSGSFITD